MIIKHVTYMYLKKITKILIIFNQMIFDNIYFIKLRKMDSERIV